MLIPVTVFERIRAGEVDLAFRRWQKPTVKTGGRLRSALGELSIIDVSVVEPDSITDEEAIRAGAVSAEDLRADLFRERKSSGRGRTAKPTEKSLIYRVELRYAGEDTRIALRVAELSESELEALVAKVRAMEQPH
jgi:hypothetical protein